MERVIPGIHPVTAIAGEPQTNIDFYAGILGLRLVKLTVNFDDPTTSHGYYGDGQSQPGTIALLAGFGAQIEAFWHQGGHDWGRMISSPHNSGCRAK